jgi:hypothetical protein
MNGLRTHYFSFDRHSGVKHHKPKPTPNQKKNTDLFLVKIRANLNCMTMSGATAKVSEYQGISAFFSFRLYCFANLKICQNINGICIDFLLLFLCPRH